MDVSEARRQIPLLKNGVYLDSAGAGPPPLQVYDAMRKFLDDWRDHGENWEAWLLEIVRARQLFARLIGADADEVACIPSVSYGLGALAIALPSKPEKANVVVSELNFPTNVYIWHSLKNRGLITEVRVQKAQNGEIPLSEYEKAIDNHTVAVSVDYVSWMNGCREDVRSVSEIAHSHGAVMVVDAFHALGALPVDAREADADVLVCGTYKWLMGPHGTAFMYVNKELLKELSRPIVGWHGIADSVIARITGGQDVFGRPFDLSGVTSADDATRFEWGTWSVITVVGSSAAIEFTMKYPPDERAPIIEKLTDRLIDGLRGKGYRITSPLGKSRRSGIVTFQADKAAELAKRLQSEGVIVAPRWNTIRVSPHFFNLKEDVDKLLERI